MLKLKLANLLEDTPVRFVSHLVPMSDMVKKGEEARILTLFDVLNNKNNFFDSYKFLKAQTA